MVQSLGTYTCTFRTAAHRNLRLWKSTDRPTSRSSSRSKISTIVCILNGHLESEYTHQLNYMRVCLCVCIYELVLSVRRIDGRYCHQYCPTEVLCTEHIQYVLSLCGMVGTLPTKLVKQASSPVFISNNKSHSQTKICILLNASLK